MPTSFHPVPECEHERNKQDERDRRDEEFEVLCSKFRKPRTSDLEPSSISPVPLFSQVSLCEV
jgi:hypothetical protein